MNALRILRDALRPRGLLLNIHPEADHAPVEVCIGDQIFPLGRLDETRHIQDVHIARAALRTVLDAGWFVVERESWFTFVSHFDTVDSWLAYMAEHASKAVIPTDLVARARALLPPGTEGEVRSPRMIYAARLRRG